MFGETLTEQISIITCISSLIGYEIQHFMFRERRVLFCATKEQIFSS